MATLSDIATRSVKPVYPARPTRRKANGGNMVNVTLAKLIGARLASLREAAGETQEETAAATGYSRSSVANIEAGSQPIGLGSALAFADHFKVPMDYLLCRAVPPGGPLVGQFVEDRDILAFIRFWDSLDDRDRQSVVRILRIPNASR